MQYNYINAIKEMRAKLVKEGYESYSDEILDAQLSGFMKTEIIEEMLIKLLEIRRKNKEVYKIIAQDADEFIKYARSIGLH